MGASRKLLRPQVEVVESLRDKDGFELSEPLWELIRIGGGSEMVDHLVDPFDIVDLVLLAGWSLIFLKTPNYLQDHLQTLLGISLSVGGLFYFPGLILAGRLSRAFWMIKTGLRWLKARRMADETIDENWFYRGLLQIINLTLLYCIGTEELVRLYFGLGLLYDAQISFFNWSTIDYRRKLVLAKTTFWIGLLSTLPFVGLIIWTGPILSSIPITGSYLIGLYDNQRKLFWEEELPLRGASSGKKFL